jgi:hypothetical protein
VALAIYPVWQVKEREEIYIYSLSVVLRGLIEG